MNPPPPTPDAPQRSPAEVTRLISLAAGGDRAAEGDLLEVVHSELRQIAAHYLKGERGANTLQATVLVNEAYLRLFRPGGDETGIAWSSRAAFFRVAAQAMRRILIDRARMRMADRRGGGAARADVPLDVLAAAEDAEPERLVSLDAAIVRLEQVDARAAEVVRLRFFAGLSSEQVAEVLGVASRTIKRDWEFARAWLAREVASEGTNS
ncbi:MAG: ECF-type sigma factor [Phycisphaerales bacterium]